MLHRTFVGRVRGVSKKVYLQMAVLTTEKGFVLNEVLHSNFAVRYPRIWLAKKIDF